MGAGQTGSAGVLFFMDERPSGRGTAGVFASWGGFARGFDGREVCYPAGVDGTNFAKGAYAGGGLNLLLSNARQAADLGGPARTWSINVGWGPRALSLQFTMGANGTWLASYGGPLPGVPMTGLGYGVSFSSYGTNTWIGPK